MLPALNELASVERAIGVSLRLAGAAPAGTIIGRRDLAGLGVGRVALAAHVLFPNDVPAGQQPPPASVAAVKVPAGGNAAPHAGEAVAAKDDAAKLFASEVSPSEHDGAVERLEVLADAVRLGGDADRVAALTEASVSRRRRGR